MSWWDDIVDDVEGAFNAITGRPSAAQQRQQAADTQAQIKAYQDQTALAKEQLDEARNATDAQKRKVEEKQIRSLRSNYRSPNSGSSGSAGMLGVGTGGTSDMNANLGG